jgi:predicted nuclease of predicted toxin-antitoxin system
MRILLDECVPRQLRKYLAGHDVATVASSGWGIKNGRLLDLAREFLVVHVSDK